MWRRASRILEALRRTVGNDSQPATAPALRMHEARQLARPAAQSCPERTALVAEGSERHLRGARGRGDLGRPPARRLRGAARRPTVAHRCTRAASRSSCLHAPDEARRGGAAAQPAARRARARRRARRRRPDVDLHDARPADPDRGRPAAARRARHGRSPLPDPDQRHLGRAASRSGSPTGTPSAARSAPAFNIGVEPDDRWLCCLPLSHVAGLSIVLRSVDLRDRPPCSIDGFDTERVATRPRRRTDHASSRWSRPS